MHALDPIRWLTPALALIGIAYQLAALWALLRFFARADRPTPRSEQAVTILKPLHGAEPRLAENLATFLDQDHAGPLQMVCGVGSASDGALPAVNALRAARAGADVALTFAANHTATNGKIGNLIQMAPAAAHEVLVLSDSDMAVTPDYLPRLLATLALPEVGAVTCLYVGRGDAGLWSAIGAAAISTQMMPNMVIGHVTGLARPCMGSTIALTRETLARIGHFERFAHVLADDHAIGAAVRELGLTVAIPPMLTTHCGDEASLAELWRHHLRWAVTIRDLAGPGHYGSLVTHALPLALIAGALTPSLALPLIATALAARYALYASVNRVAGRRLGPFGLVLAADLLSFAVFVASLFAQKIDWRGAGLTMGRNGSIARHP